MKELPDLEAMSALLRVLCADMVEEAGSGHPGMPMGMADVAAVLFANHLTFVPDHPEWIARDRFVLSSGHGSALAYALLHLIGQPAMTLEQLRNLRRRGSLTPGHPEYGHTPGIECTTGPLGQGFATAVGMAIAEKKLSSEVGSDIAGHKVFVMAGDGCLMEGISHEAGALAAHLQLDNLVVLFDNNAISIDGAISLTSSEDVLGRFAAYGWHVIAVDGHNHASVDTALHDARAAKKPTLIACKTQIGRGAPSKAGTAGIHGSPLGASESDAMRKALNWPHKPFELPDHILTAWRQIGRRGSQVREQWLARLSKQSEAVRHRIEQIEHRRLPSPPQETLAAIRQQALAQLEPMATRVSSKAVLDRLAADCPWLVGGSADLSGSNGTRTAHHRDFTSLDSSGNYLRYGIREHAMAAAMNGIALSGAYVPYGGTFLVFSDYCRPAIRLSALMGLRVLYVFTHDSIGLGEDGPTHQPIEHLASLRLIPGLKVFRPADAVEAAECWELALSHDGPSVLALSRQNVPLLRNDVAENRSASGAYKLKSASTRADATLFATGSEVHVALEAANLLAQSGYHADVVSVPCLDMVGEETRKNLFEEADGLRVAIEAGAPLSWLHLVGDNGLVCGIETFGESAAGEELFEHFGMTATALVETISRKLETRKPA